MNSVRTLVTNRVGLVNYIRQLKRRASRAQLAMADQSPSKSTVEEEPLPKLTPTEFREYNRLAEMMDRYHNHFRQTWNMMYDACVANKRPSGMSIRQFMSVGDRWIQGLTLHHTIEEQQFYPMLARRMPAFKQEVHLLTQHKRIHEGLDRLEKYLTDCKTGKMEFRMSEMKTIMDTFGEVLWEHLDDEVNQLKADEMRKFWTLEEMRRMHS